MARKFELATGNLLMGRFLWLLLDVPEGWTVKVGDIPSDVYYTTIVEGNGWITDGSTSYFLVNLVNGEVYDLELKVKKGVKELGRLMTSGGEKIMVNGHIATVVHREVKRGFRRTPMKQIAITVPCDRTLRTIEMTVTGKNSDELDQIKQSLTNSRCH
ncbi:MAG: hypothetical protein QW299_00835 [Candidatus Caldarchaeum sp.]